MYAFALLRCCHALTPVHFISTPVPLLVSLFFYCFSLPLFISIPLLFAHRRVFHFHFSLHVYQDLYVSLRGRDQVFLATLRGFSNIQSSMQKEMAYGLRNGASIISFFLSLSHARSWSYTHFIFIFFGFHSRPSQTWMWSMTEITGNMC